MQTTSRNNEIAGLNDIGLPHASIALEYGLTRERVRQIVGSLRQTTRSQHVEDQWDIAFKDAIRRGISMKSLAEELSCSYEGVRLRAKRLGYRLMKDPKPVRNTPDGLCDGAMLVASGASLSAAARQVGVDKQRLFLHCKKNGIRSAHRSLNPAYASGQRP